MLCLPLAGKQSCKEFLNIYKYMYTLSITPSGSSQGSLEGYYFREKKCQIYLCICIINPQLQHYVWSRYLMQSK